MTAAECLTGIFVRPRAVARHLADHPGWIVAFAAAAVLVAVTAYLTYPIVNEEMADRMADSFFTQFMTEEQLAEMQAEMRNPTQSARLRSIIQPVLFLLGVQIALNGFLTHVLARAMGGNGRPRSVVALYAHARLISPAASELAKLPFVFASGSYFNVNLSLAALVPGMSMGDLPHDILSIFSIFGVACLAVLVVGIQEIHGISRERALIAAGLPWLAGGLMAAVFAAVSF